VKTQQPIASDEEHRVLQFRPRTVAPSQGRLREPGDGAVKQDTIKQDTVGQGTVRQDTVRQDTVRQDLRGAANDLSRYERDRSEPDDFRHRMLANLAALAFTIALTAVGIWLAMNIADLRKTQDCVLMGRRDCARISTPHF
jgi:hypothetical protein